MPKISVIMPAYNAEKYIAEAIDSILWQTFTDFELIILNDHSSDRTEEIILSYKDPRIVYVKNEQNLGVAGTLNRGLDMAKGEYIARMDADDISLPERFVLQTAYLEEHPDCGICGSNLTVFGEGLSERMAVYPQKNAAIRADQLFSPAFAHPAVMFRRMVLEKAGGKYDPTYEKAEDYELWYRMLGFCEGYNIQKPLLRYRHHGGQVTVTCKKEQKDAVVRLHKRMLREMDAGLTEAETHVFLRICAGERKFTREEYAHFVKTGKKLIAVAEGFGSAVRTVFAGLNMQIKKESGVNRGGYFLLKEPVYAVYSRFRGR